MSVVRKIAMLIIGLAALSIWSNLVFRNAENKGKPGLVNNIIRSFSTLPQQIKRYWNDIEYLSMSQTFVAIDPEFEEINILKDDLFFVNSYWDEAESYWITYVGNLKNDDILYKWHTESSILKNEKYFLPFRDQRPFHVLVNPDTSVIINFTETETLVKLDKNSDEIWRNEELGYHHAMNLDSVGNLWICASLFGDNNAERGGSNEAMINANGRVMPYEDNMICKIDIKTGEILFKKSLSKILIENELEGLLYNSLDHRGDPLHLNDIQPALTDSPFWKEGDLFISLRNLSSVLHYSPETNKVIKVIGGPFLLQHDVDILSDSTIGVFDNHINKNYRYVEQKTHSLDTLLVLDNNRIVAYDYASDSFRYPYKEFFDQEKINTQTEGLFEFLDNGSVFVEEQNTGIVYIFSNDEILLRKVFKVDGRDKQHITNWIRIHESNPLIQE